eukprot:1725738-Rhodomonas_salina.1
MKRESKRAYLGVFRWRHDCKVPVLALNRLFTNKSVRARSIKCARSITARHDLAITSRRMESDGLFIADVDLISQRLTSFPPEVQLNRLLRPHDSAGVQRREKERCMIRSCVSMGGGNKMRWECY